MELKDKAAIVTGASGGLGRVIALALAHAGARLVLVDINIKESEKLLAEITSAGTEGIVLEADVSRVKDIGEIVARTLSEYSQIDILVNVAGICALTPLTEITEAEWERVLDVNLKGTFFLSQAVFKEMLKRKSGKIVNIASASAKMGGVAVGAHYSASKAGVICLTKSFALRAAPYKINVNCVCPGPMETEMTEAWGKEINFRFRELIPWKEYGKPGDVAEAVLYLVSDRARYLTGEILDVNGGLIMD